MEETFKIETLCPQTKYWAYCPNCNHGASFYGYPSQGYKYRCDCCRNLLEIDISEEERDKFNDLIK